MIQRRWQLWLVFLIFAWPVRFAVAQDREISLEEALNTTGTVIMIRHALAPGFGDPSNFRVDDCSTQRNLDKRGRQQSRAIGQEFRQLNYSTPVVYSSPWCRCLDTARLMQIGPVTAFQGLGSFFEGHVDRSQSLNALSEKLSSIAKEQMQPVVMVTHQVVISAITGLGTSSGEAILYDPSDQRAIRIRLNSSD
ncbi:histidine phosphatase family protein [Litoricolaceae bacterium]|nr:histidine phosphatase family protein [Litorivicinaceae bacterium]